MLEVWRCGTSREECHPHREPNTDREVACEPRQLWLPDGPLAHNDASCEAIPNAIGEAEEAGTLSAALAPAADVRTPQYRLPLLGGRYAF